jgi:hypothetical protein
VDAFSVTSEHLARAVEGYGISAGKIDVIHTGVDAEEEFSPRRATPVNGLDPARTHLLYPGRLVEQKDPLLMVEVAAALRERTPAFQIHAVGEGDLEPAVRRAIAERGLEEVIRIHPPTNRLEGWYSACDALLMTSVYEGVPYVVFEAMAMELPVVAPALPGNLELLGDVAGALVEPRDDVAAYAGALLDLIERPERRVELGRRGRERVRERFSLQGMGQAHGALYDRLLQLASKPEPLRPDPADAPQLAGPPLRFVRRGLHDTPLVSVIVPCYNHGRFLGDCLDAIRAQTHPAVETIVVDDASTDPETIAVLDELERRDDLTLVRMRENGGPSRARNAALDRCTGRYVLPVDADNILFPDAIERLLEQLRSAGERVGFIYPNLEYFGNREDYFEAPDWNLYTLMKRNVCDVCGLFDREVFDAERFDEGIRLGHEDWEFVMRLAARGARGEPANSRTVRYRKIGFNRSDTVEYGASAFQQVVASGLLYNHELYVKAHSTPALSLIALEPVEGESEAGVRLSRRLDEQSCRDFELIARVEGALRRSDRAPALRSIPAALANSTGEALRHALPLFGGRYLGITTGTGSGLLADRGFVEKVLRVFEGQGHGRNVDALVLARCERPGLFPMQLLRGTEHVGRPHTLVLSRDAEERLLNPLRVDAGEPLRSLVEACVAVGLRLQWRHADLGRERHSSSTPAPVELRRISAGETRGGIEGEAWRWPPELPSIPGVVPRWTHTVSWTPPQSGLLCRHREIGGERRVVLLDRNPPPGFQLEWDLGAARIFSLEGTVRLLALENGEYTTMPRGTWEQAPEGAVHLGYLEEVAFPMFEALLLARHRGTGQQVVVSGSWDPLLAEVDVIATLGFIEPFPANPRAAPPADHPFGLVGLTRAVDLDARRHRYAAGQVAEGVFAGELGALAQVGQAPAVPVWIADGWLVTEGHAPAAERPSTKAVGKWTLAPGTWRNFSEPLPKARAVARRTVEAGKALRRSRPAAERPEGPPVGWLLHAGGAGTRPLYAAYHPVTGDQLITNAPLEATDMGYAQPELLGHVRAVAPVTGSLGPQVTAVPWASRFGLAARRT